MVYVLYSAYPMYYIYMGILKYCLYVYRFAKGLQWIRY